MTHLSDRGVELRGRLGRWLMPQSSTILYEEIRHARCQQRVVSLELLDDTRRELKVPSSEQARQVVDGLEHALHPAAGMLPDVDTVGALARSARQVLDRRPMLPSAVWELILLGAARLQASDLHLDADAESGRLEVRVDGLIQPLVTLDPEVSRLLINRLKVMAGLLSYCTDRPQEGRLEVRLGRRAVSARVTTTPGLHGELAAVRLHDPRKASLRLDQLGFDDGTLEQLERLADLERGLVLVSGPPSSGKTTTLFSLLRRIQQQRGRASRFFSIEDPVEVDLPGVAQAQVDEARGNTYASLLRVVLRQDADVVAVGEIRDRETAEMVIRASLRGHLVLSTVHAGSVQETLERLRDLCPDGDLLRGTLRAVLCQRLKGRPCPACEGRGCARCGATGRRGRRATGEAALLDAGEASPRQGEGP